MAVPRPRTRPLVVAVVIAALAGGGTPLVFTVVDGPMTGRGPSVLREASVGDLAVSEEGEARAWVSGATGGSSIRRLTATAPPPGKRHALIVGINHARGGRPLPGSHTDAKNLQKALLQYGFRNSNVKVLLEQKATRSAILSEIDRLAARTPRDGVAVFAVATHTRRGGGQNELLTVEGGRISAGTLGSHLGKVRSKMWVALPTCYAEGYAVPGIVGKNRIATFASGADQPTYQVGTAGSYLFINMVRKAMVEQLAPQSVEAAFSFAKRTLEREAPNRVPTVRDGIKGDLVLGRVAQKDPRPAVGAAHAARPRTSFGSSDVQGSPAEPSPSPTPRPRRNTGPSVCGQFSFNCQR